jgi:hypothetical protein
VRRLAAVVLAVAALAAAGASTAARAAEPAGRGGPPPRLNDLQARGTHNSYHRDPGFPGREQVGWDYSHAPLAAQLEELGVRQVELDVHYNWARRDFEVYHAWFADDRSTCALLRDCLAELTAWSDDHPGHHPVMVLIEPKDSGVPYDQELPEDGDPFTRPIGPAEYAQLDGILLGAFGGRVLTPDTVTGAGLTLRESILRNGWPRLDEVRQHGVFVIDGDDHGAAYSAGWTSLAGRAMFVQADPDADVAAFVSRDGDRLPGEGRYDRIRRLVAQGFMVRDLVSPDGFEEAKAAGAQFLSTDFPDQLELSGDPAAPSRCNPVTTAGRRCLDPAIETHGHGTPYPVPEHPGDGPGQVAAEKADRLVLRSLGSAAALVGLDAP